MQISDVGGYKQTDKNKKSFLGNQSERGVETCGVNIASEFHYSAAQTKQFTTKHMLQ